MNTDANCKGIHPDRNFKHLDQTYMMPKQYEAYDHLYDCKGIRPDRNFKHLDQTYMMPKQYEAYKHGATCNGNPTQRNYMHLGQTYMMPTATELFKHDSRLACIGLQPQGNFMHLNQTYMMPRQYEAFKPPRKIVGVEKNFLNTTGNMDREFVKDKNIFSSTGDSQKPDDDKKLQDAIVNTISDRLGLNLQKPILQNNIKKPVYTAVNKMESVDDAKDSEQCNIPQNFLNLNTKIASLAFNN